jgi:hypothetical protein
MILNLISEKDPRMALERFVDEAGDENSSGVWQVRTALRDWSEKQPAAAAAWLDRQIAAGKFTNKSLDGKNHEHNRLEAVLVTALLKANPGAAAARVMALPEYQREDLFRQDYYFQVPADSEDSYAALVRETMSPGNATAILAHAAGTMASMENYKRVDNFISSANVTQVEKQAIVEDVVKRMVSLEEGQVIDVGKLEDARAWASAYSPEAADKATGAAFAATLDRGGDFKKASEMMLKFHETANGDEVLAGFLRSKQVSLRPPGETGPLIGKIKDPALREEISTQLLEQN